MVDSEIVLNGQTFAYTFYAIAIILLMSWFGYNITRKGKSSRTSKVIFYSFTALLVVLGVSLHIVTYNTIPWVEMDVNRGDYTPNKTFSITVEDHQFMLPSEKLMIDCNDLVLFDVQSNDLTYGFGLFRQDNSMIFQMQVVPGHRNDILWHFSESGLYTIRSTEYSGPKGAAMILKDVVEVVGCDQATGE